MSPSSLPPGLSPSCANVSFEPGSVFTRPAFVRLLSSPILSDKVPIDNIFQEASSSIVDATSVTPHGLVVGDMIRAVNFTQPGYNGNFIVVSVLSTYTFRYISLSGNLTPESGTGTIYKVNGNSPTFTYVKSYIQPNGDPLTLFLDSDGVFYKEDIINQPGILQSVDPNVQPGSYGYSITTESREYLTFFSKESITNVTGGVTFIQIFNDVLTAICPGNPFKVGQAVKFTGFTNAPFLNGNIMAITYADTGGFKGTFVHNNYENDTDTGTATLQSGQVIVGSDIPRVFDGTNFDRLNQDGPGAKVTATEVFTNVDISTISMGGPIASGPVNGHMTLKQKLDGSYTQILFRKPLGPDGVYSGQGAAYGTVHTGNSLVFNSVFNGYPIYGFQSNNGDSGAWRRIPMSNQQQDVSGAWTYDNFFLEAYQGGKQGYAFDCNIQGIWHFDQPGHYTLYFAVDDSWVLHMNNGATYVSGPQTGSAPSFYGYTQMAARLTTAKNFPNQPTDKVVINIPSPGDYNFEIGWGNRRANSITYMQLTWAQGDGPAPGPNVLYPIGGNLLPFVQSNPVSVSEVADVVTVQTPTPHSFAPGDFVAVTGFGTTQYNGVFKVLTVPSPNTFTYTNSNTGLTNDSGGTVAPLIATCVTVEPHALIVDDNVNITGDSQGAYNNGSGNPTFWTVSAVIDPNTFQFVGTSNPGGSGTGGSFVQGGQISEGVHKVVCFFETLEGGLTAPSPIGQWSTVGNRRVKIDNIPIGPSNVTKRILAFTPSGADSFFYLPDPVLGTETLSGNVQTSTEIGTSTQINDNTTETATFNFSDSSLFGGIAIDVPGNNLFDQVTVAPSVGVIEYADRLFLWGEWNKVQNFLNMGFDGGHNPGDPTGGKVPLAWTKEISSVSGYLSSGDFGFAWRIVDEVKQFANANENGFVVTINTHTPHAYVIGNQVTVSNFQETNFNGTWIVTSVPDDTSFTYTALVSGLLAEEGIGIIQPVISGRITQPAFQDEFNINILEPNTKYLLRLWAKGDQDGMVGTLVVDFFSPGGVTFTGCTATQLSNNDVKVTTPTTNAYKLGDTVTVSGFSVVQYNGTYTVDFIDSPTQFRYNITTGGLGNATGGIVQSPPTTTIATATIQLSDITTEGKFHQVSFDKEMPVTIPADTLIRVYVNFTDLVDANLGLELDEMMVIFADKPVNKSQLRTSYAGNLSAFDGVTGTLSVPDEGEEIVTCFKLRSLLFIETTSRLYSTQDNQSSEPGDWTVVEISNKVGGVSPKCTSSGEEIEFIASRSGIYVFTGSNPKKIAQAIQPIWDRINWDAAYTIWLLNDNINRILYAGIPIDSATSPNTLVTINYRGADVQYDVPDPIRQSYSGKMLAPELAEKFTTWDVSLNCATLALRPGGLIEPLFGVGNGVTPNLESAATGNLYSLDPTAYHDDDFGLINSHYMTYAVPSHDQEQAIPVLGSHNKLFGYLTTFATGVGKINSTPCVDNITNRQRTLPGRLLTLVDQEFDIEWPLQITADRCFFDMAVLPVPSRNLVPNPDGNQPGLAGWSTVGNIYFNPFAGAIQGTGGWQVIGQSGIGSQGFNPGTNGTSGPPPSGSTQWTNPQNLVNTDDQFAIAFVSPLFTADTGYATGYSFSIPSNATITGVQVEFNAQDVYATSHMFIHALSLVVGGVNVGTPKSSGTALTDTQVTYAFGTTTDLWGATLTPAMVNANDFGASIQFNNTSPATPSLGYVNNMQIRVSYSGALSQGHETVKSAVFKVKPNFTYTFSGFIDGTDLVSGKPTWGVYSSDGVTPYFTLSQNNGVNSRLSGQFAVPSNVTQVVVKADTNNCAVNNLRLLTFSDPQLELGQVITNYVNTNLDAAFNLDKLIFQVKQHPAYPNRGLA